MGGWGAAQHIGGGRFGLRNRFPAAGGKFFEFGTIICNRNPSKWMIFCSGVPPFWTPSFKKIRCGGLSLTCLLYSLLPTLVTISQRQTGEARTCKRCQIDSGTPPKMCIDCCCFFTLKFNINFRGGDRKYLTPFTLNLNQTSARSQLLRGGTDVI